MLTVTEILELRRWVAAGRLEGRRIGFVPTMGALHQGHLSLVDEARRRCGAVVMSVFVNPLQFGPQEDLARYPRDLPGDSRLAAGRGVDLLFAPAPDIMYPPGSEVRVVPGPTATMYEGAVRPGHFEGVLTVVTKLFNLVQPDLAVFGQKDIQQAVLIRRLVKDLDLPVEIVVAPTVREADGLAMSSRNAYLSDEERGQALALSRALAAARECWESGERLPAALEARMTEALAVFPAMRVDYIAIVDPDTFQPVAEARPGTIIAVAGRVGTTRLLDNLILGDARTGPARS